MRSVTRRTRSYSDTRVRVPSFEHAIVEAARNDFFLNIRIKMQLFKQQFRRKLTESLEKPMLLSTNPIFSVFLFRFFFFFLFEVNVERSSGIYTSGC